MTSKRKPGPRIDGGPIPRSGTQNWAAHQAARLGVAKTKAEVLAALVAARSLDKDAGRLKD